MPYSNPSGVQPTPLYGFKFAKAGFDLKTAGNYELLFSSGWPSLAIAFTKTITLPPSMVGPGIGQFDHPLGFPPFTMAWVIENGITTRRTFPDIDRNTIYINDASAVGTTTYYVQCYNLNISLQVSYNFIPPPPTQLGVYDVNYGTKFAKPGKSIDSHDLNDFIFHSKAMSPAILSVNTTFDNPSLQPGSNTITTTSPEGYLPWVFGYSGLTTGDLTLYTYAGPYAQVAPRLFIGPTTLVPSLVKGQFMVSCDASATTGALILLRDPLFVANTVDVTF